MQLFREILNRIVYETDADLKIVSLRAAASSINLPAINEQPTRKPTLFILHPSAFRDLALLIAQRLNDPSFNGEMELRRIFL